MPKRHSLVGINLYDGARLEANVSFVTIATFTNTLMTRSKIDLETATKNIPYQAVVINSPAKKSGISTND